MFRTALLISALLLPPHPGAAQDAEVGVMAAVNRDVTGERPRETPRALILNDRLVLDERVTTSEVGGGQVLFLDQTTLTLSPGSDVILDRYVYDPDQRSGELTASILRGAMRIVGGRITKTGGATIRTPTATIGIRGGIGQVTVGRDGSTRYIHIAGQSSTITNDAGEVTVTRQGATVDIPARRGEGPGGGGRFDERAESPTDVADSLRSYLNTRSQATVRRARIGRLGGRPVFTGVAQPEQVRAAIRRSGGVGDGGARRPVTRGRIAEGVERVRLRVSGAARAPQAPPISTTGEQEEAELDAPPVGLAELPTDEFAEDTVARNIAEEIDALQDGLEFRGEWTALAGLRDGTFVARTPGLAFDMEYSLASREGVVIVELPETGDLAEANLTTLGGAQIRGDRFIVTGDVLRNLTGDNGAVTLLGGDASDVDLQILDTDEARGVILIDYEDADLPNLQFVDGEITSVTGTRRPPAPIEQRVQDARSGR